MDESEEEEEEEEGETEREGTVDEETLFNEREVTECFAVFDPKSTGMMPSKYLGKALRALGINLTASEVEELIVKYDKKGFIEEADFAEYAVEKLTQMDPLEHLQAAFAAFDLDNEGVIPKDRIKKWMTSLGEPLTESEANELYKMGDPAGLGVFSYSDVIPRLLY